MASDDTAPSAAPATDPHAIDPNGCDRCGSAACAAHLLEVRYQAWRDSAATGGTEERAAEMRELTRLQPDADRDCGTRPRVDWRKWSAGALVAERTRCEQLARVVETEARARSTTAKATRNRSDRDICAALASAMGDVADAIRAGRVAGR